MEFLLRLEKWFLSIVLCSIVFCLYPVWGAEDLNLFRIGTGGKTGVYYPVGKMIAQGISNQAITIKNNESARPFLSIAQNSGGSVDNVKGVIANEIEAGLVQADVAELAFQGKSVFKDDPENGDIRAIASLYPEKFQIVVRRDAKIKNMKDLHGKRISVDEMGSGTLAVVRIVLEAYGLNEKDLDPVYLKPVFTHDKIVNGYLQGFAMMAGAPMEAVNKLLHVGISIVPVEPEVALKITQKHPYLVAGKIGAGIYTGIPETPTIQVHALLVVNKAMDEKLAYKITEALWTEQTLSLLKAGHPQGKSISPDTALTGISIPLHRGAEKYYQQHAGRFAGLNAK